MLEINPLVVTKQGELRVLDAKVSFDDNALYRHPDVVALRDETEEDAKEIEASKYDLNYVTLDGNIGCMVNGAGLAMATMDIIKLYGMAPANFLDVGGGASKEKVAAAFKIITADPNVKGILVNIFGGIMKCDIIAEGVAAAPSPLEEHRKLAVFAGEWNGEEMVYPSRWTAGGPATSHVVARIDLNGFYLIQDARRCATARRASPPMACSPTTARTGPTNCSGTIRSATTRRRRPPAAGPASR